MKLQRLSELYGLIGQLLREHGDAPIGEEYMPIKAAFEPIHPIETIRPEYVDIRIVENKTTGIRTYRFSIVGEEEEHLLR